MTFAFLWFPTVFLESFWRIKAESTFLLPVRKVTGVLYIFSSSFQNVSPATQGSIFWGPFVNTHLGVLPFLSEVLLWEWPQRTDLQVNTGVRQCYCPEPLLPHWLMTSLENFCNYFDYSFCAFIDFFRLRYHKIYMAAFPMRVFNGGGPRG